MGNGGALTISASVKMLVGLLQIMVANAIVKLAKKTCESLRIFGEVGVMANDLTASNQISTGTQIALVSARLLHTQLGVKKDFTDWFKQQVARCGSIEGEDYFASILPQKGENSVSKSQIERILSGKSWTHL